MLKLRTGGQFSTALPRVAMAVTLLFSIVFVIFEETNFRVDAPLPQISLLILAAFIGLGTMRRGSIFLQGKNMVSISVAYWSIFTALVIPAISPLLIVNSFLVVLAAVYLEKYYAIIATMVLVIAIEASYILGNDHSLTNLAFLTVHLLSLVLIVLIGSWYHTHSKNAQNITDAETERSNLERERLQTLINSMTDGVIATDTSGVVAVYNGSALDILNLNASLEGENISKYLHVINHEGEAIDVMEMARQQQGYLVSRDYLLSFDEVENINLYLSISPVKIGFGHEGSEGLIMLLRDITREKSIEEERDEFISVVSHELRTPVTIAEGNISNAELVAEKGEASKEVVASLGSAHKQVVFLADMINDLATLSRAERGKLKDTPEDIDIHELIKSLQRDYRADAQHKSITLKTHVDKDVGSIFSSRLYVREILQNFITNAIKYTQEGDIKIDVKKVGARVEFAVTDSGIGISQTDQKHLFKKFFRSEDYRTRENSGTGLGLYVTMKLAKLIHAQIGVSSELNKGSTFTVTVPSMKNEEVDVD